jgi:choline dehydrogenase-like flavoprotein
MEAAPSAIQRDLLLLVKVLCTVGYTTSARVEEVVGYEARCAVRDSERAREHQPLVTAPPLDEDCDVVIVGSGAGGAVAAALLAEAGLDVVVLEAGRHVDRRSYPDDPLEALKALYRDGGLTVAEGRPPIALPVGRAVGGTTVINSGTCFRPPEDVLATWADEHGIDWATDLDAEYAAAEEFLDVTPVDPERMGRNGQLCMAGAASLGASGGPIRRNAGACVQCSSCPFGCPIDAKRAMHVSYLPRAAAAGARVRSDAEVDGVIVERGRAVGVRGRTVDDGASRRFEVRARAVVSAAGALGTPELLLRSGLGSGPVGRNLHVHPACWVGALYDTEVRGWEGVMQSYYVDEWHDRGLLLEATFTPLAFGAHWLPGVGHEHAERILAFDRVGSIGVHLSDRSAGRVGRTRDGSLRVTYRLTPEDARTLCYGIARAAEIHFAAGAREVYPQIGGVPTIPRGRVADFEARTFPAAALRLEAFHPMGTARIGADPATSVVGPDGAAHGLDRLYIADASLLPTSLGVNPMMTIIAFASRISGEIAAAVAA